MQFFNSLTRRKEAFRPKEPGRVSIYVCGITAYDLCHIGHARAAVVFDVLVRFLRHRGLEATFIRNFTDVDDKIIKRALEEGRSSEAVSRAYIEAFYQDMDRLNVLRADIEPKATEHIEDMQRLIARLLEKGQAYATPSGDVYFRVRSFPDYGFLSGRDIEELQSGARIEPGEEKEDPLDFALWKRAKPEEPAWPSPWGEGRPGWHIECSAMSERYVDLPLDIHAGGQDLIFPHHENERAQSMAASGGEFVRYWMHNGFVRVQSEKMSKSLGNFITLRDIFGFFLPEVLRFFLLSTHYRSPLDFSWEALKEAEKGLKRIYQTKDQLEQALSRSSWKKTALDPKDRQEVKDIFEQWQASLEDDLNTAAALGHVFNLVRLANRLLEDKAARQSEEGRELFQGCLDNIAELGSILGVFIQESRAFLTSLRDSRAARRQIDTGRVEALLSQRQQARREKDFQQADALREELNAMGVEVQDTPQGPVWDVE
jgi:cysteinyl-tRNA synthetase